MKARKLIFFWWKVAFLFLYRSLRATGIMSLMLMSAVAALIFLSALAMGVNDAMVRNSVSLYSGHISGFNIPGDVRKDALAVPGTAAVLKRLSSPGMLVKGSKLHEVIVTEIEPPEELQFTAVGRKIAAGTYLTGTKGEVLLGRSLAGKMGVSPGDTVDFKPVTGTGVTTLRVAGIYDTGIDRLDRETAFCPLGSLHASGNVWSAAVFLKEGVEPGKVISAYRNIIGGSAEFKSWETLMPDLKQLIDLNYVSMGIVILLVFGVVSLGIACAFVIIILKSIREYGILKAMGVTSRETMLLIFFEVLLMNLFASSLGVILGILLSVLVQSTGIDLTAYTSHNQYFTVSGVIYPRLTPFAWGAPPALAFLFSLIAAVWPAVLVSRRRAAEILRMV